MVKECWFKESSKENLLICLKCGRLKSFDFLVLDGNKDKDLLRFIEGSRYTLYLLDCYYSITLSEDFLKILKALEIRIACEIYRGASIQDFEKRIVTKIDENHEVSFSERKIERAIS